MGSTVQVNGSAYINTDFMKVAGFPTIPFSSTSTTAWGNVKMRVALALDNTGSMADNGKIAALRTAASNLVDQLSALAKNPGDVYISVVPFAKVVNVGSSNYGATWIDWTDWQNPPTQQPNNWHLPGNIAEQLGQRRTGLDLSIHEQQQRFRLHQQPRERQFDASRAFRRAAPTRATSARASTTTRTLFTTAAGPARQTTTQVTYCTGSSLQHERRQQHGHLHRQRQRQGLQGIHLHSHLGRQCHQHLDRLRHGPHPEL